MTVDRNRCARMAAPLVALAVGLLVGYGCGESARQGGANARASKLAPPEGGTAAPAAPEGQQPMKVRRFGQVIGLKPEMKEKYVEMHANTWPGVLDQIRKSNIRNYSIYLTEIEGKLYLFSYLEYVGDDWEADMKTMADDPTMQKWWAETDPCQIRMPGTPEGKQWLEIEEVFHTD